MARGIRRVAPDGDARRSPPGPAALRSLVDELPGDLRERALTHASWVDHRADSYGRLAFLGDSVLGLAIAEDLFRRFPRSDIGRLTEIHGQVVSGQACAEVTEELGLPGLMAAIEPGTGEGGIVLEALLEGERARASVCESVIGAAYLHHGWEKTAGAVIAAFAERTSLAAETTLNHKAALQELLARRGERVRYEVLEEEGPDHDRSFRIAAIVADETVGTGTGRSKKIAEQEAAAEALERLQD